MKSMGKNLVRGALLILLFLAGVWLFRQDKASAKLTTESLPPVQPAILPESEMRSEARALAALVSSISAPLPPVSSGAQSRSGTEPQSNKVDNEWETFLRISDKLEDYLAKPSLIETRRLFRHTLLNPSDVYIRPSDRQLLDSLVGYYVGLIERAEKLRAQIATKELSALVKQGAARGVPADRLLVKNYLSNLPEKERERKAKGYTAEEIASDNTYVLDPRALFPGEETLVTRHVGGTVYGATLRELPQAARAEEIRDYLIMELAGAITSFFVQQVGFSTDSPAELLSAMAAFLDKR